jgi:hypothetical protein
MPTKIINPEAMISRWTPEGGIWTRERMGKNKQMNQK